MNDKYTFTQKTWIAGFIFALITILILLFNASIHIFILILVGVLIACFFHGLAKLITRKTKFSRNTALLISIIGTILLAGGMFYAIGAVVSKQFIELQKGFPEMIEEAEVYLNQSSIGSSITSYIEQLTESEDGKGYINDAFTTTFGGIGDVFIILLLGIYFTSTPLKYRNGILQIVPYSKRSRAKDLLNKIGSGLTRWLLGKFISMGIIFVLTAIILFIAQVPMWLALAFISGLLVFIPNFGPILAAIPTILVALSVSVKTAIVVAILYLVIQLFEGGLITPKLQEKMISVPPALIILAQVFTGTLIGAWGLVFATPIMLILFIMVKELYVRPMNEKNHIPSFKGE